MNDEILNPARRRFLGQLMGGTFGMMFPWVGNIAAAASADDYRALVCVYLFGGNDSANMVVPAETGSHAEYQQLRGNLSVPLDQLLPVAVRSSQRTNYGFHPALAPLHDLYNQDELAVVANVGTLIEPVTRQDILNGNVPLPPQLFSHSDQIFQWQTGIPGGQKPVGWGGRLADLFAGRYSSLLPMNITLGEQAVFLTGERTEQYALSVYGPESLDGLSGDGAPIDIAVRRMLAQSARNLMESQYLRVQNRAVDLYAALSDALDGEAPFATVFPDTELGMQLRMAARVISQRSEMGGSDLGRQIFLVGMGGFDTHDGQNDDQPNLFAELATAVRAFRDAMAEVGELERVTLFTASEFGRTLTNNGDGTDHGWGGHHFVVGGAVQGGDIYGIMPDLTLEGPDDAGDGRQIPTLATDQYYATLARWFGANDAELNSLFPHLSRFDSTDLGFMSAG